jgi:(E)-4-hydroxy-3-methylbut-2-enyl-diphosphate synthase
MGCAVNGPGEAKDADYGIAGMDSGRFALFRKGKRIKNIDAKEAIDELISEILKDE